MKKMIITFYTSGGKQEVELCPECDPAPESYWQTLTGADCPTYAARPGQECRKCKRAEGRE